MKQFSHPLNPVLLLLGMLIISGCTPPVTQDLEGLPVEPLAAAPTASIQQAELATPQVTVELEEEVDPPVPLPAPVEPVPIDVESLRFLEALGKSWGIED